MRILFIGDIVGAPGREIVRAELEAAAGVNEYLALALFAGDVFDGVNGHGHGEELADFGFVNVEGHGSLSERKQPDG